MKKLSYMTILCLIIVFILIPSSLSANINPLSKGFIDGYLLDIRADVNEAGIIIHRADIETYSGAIFQFVVHPQAVLTIDNIPVKPMEFRSGMEIYAGLQGMQIISMESYATANMGHISPGSKMRIGKISNIERDQIRIHMANGREETYYTNPGTLVQRKNNVVRLDTLYVGDRVKLFFDQINSDIISRMQVEGDSILIKNVYRAKIEQVDNIENALTLASVEVFRNGNWQSHQASMKMQYRDEFPIYAGGYEVPRHNLKYYRGQSVYLVTRNILGREQIDRLIIKQQYESSFSDKISEINWYTEAFELKNNKNVAFNKSSIIIQNGRLQDKYVLSAGSDAFVLVDGRGAERLASLIYIYNNDINASNIGQRYLYIGRLDQIVEDKVWLKDYFILDHNEWVSFSDVKELFYDHDTSIYDLDKKHFISPKEFLAGDYSIDPDSERVRENNLHDYYAYVYTDGDRIASIAVQKDMDSLLRQRISSGIIANIGDDASVGWSMTIRDSQDWSNNRSQWMPKNADLRMNLGQAMIIKNGKMIMPHELKLGDRLYVLRDDFRARVVIVK